MGYEVVREPYILFETIELLYKFVNKISFRSVLRKGRQPDSVEQDRSFACHLDRLQEIVDEVCTDLNPNNPALQRFFAAVDASRKQDALCLARCLTVSFTSLGYPGLEESVSEICDTWHMLQSKGAWIKGYRFRSLIMSFEEGSPGDLIDQICAMDLPAEFQLNLYRALRHFDKTMQELLELIRPVADRLAAKLAELDPVTEKVRAYWRSAPVEPLTFVQGIFGPSAIRGAGEHTALIISVMDHKWIFYDMEESSINLSGRNFIMIGCGVTVDSFLENDEIMLDSASATLKILSDRRRLDVLRRLGKNRSYCHELADVMDSDPGNMSRTLATLYECGFLRQQREAQRNYYQTDREAVHAFFQQVEDLLFR